MCSKHSGSVCIHVSILSRILFPYGLIQSIEQSSRCSTVGPAGYLFCISSRAHLVLCWESITWYADAILLEKSCTFPYEIVQGTVWLKGKQGDQRWEREGKIRPRKCGNWVLISGTLKFWTYSRQLCVSTCFFWGGWRMQILYNTSHLSESLCIIPLIIKYSCFSLHTHTHTHTHRLIFFFFLLFWES